MNYKTILEENKDNADLMREIVQEVNSWDSSLDSYEVMEFDDDFFSTYFEGRPEEAARATFFGNIQNWMDDYIRFNGYGNLESLNSYQYEKELEEGADEIISRAVELHDEGHLELDVILSNNNIEAEDVKS